MLHVRVSSFISCAPPIADVSSDQSYQKAQMQLFISRWMTSMEKNNNTLNKHVKNILQLNIRSDTLAASFIIFFFCTCNIPKKIMHLSYSFDLGTHRTEINLCSFSEMINDLSFYCLYLKLYCIIWDVKKYLCPKDRFIFFAK